MLQTISLLVTGRVHGVFYRQSARKKAMELGITGTVQNNPDGSVSIMATGETTQLDKFVEWSKQGPATAHVARVTLQQEPLRSFKGFEVIR